MYSKLVKMVPEPLNRNSLGVFCDTQVMFLSFGSGVLGKVFRGGNRPLVWPKGDSWV